MKLAVLQPELLTLIYWMVERDLIRAAKESGKPKPWTRDKLLQNYRWCNVRRLDDRVSRWLFEHWYQDGDSPRVQLTRAALARLINWPDSLAEINGDFPELDAVRRHLSLRALAGAKVFTGAYIIPPPPRNGINDGETKIDGVIGLVKVLDTYAHEVTSCASIRSAWKEITRWEGLGSFLAGQIVADLAHLPVGWRWHDRSTWAPIGPGSARGLNRLLGRPLTTSVSQELFEDLLPQLIDLLRPQVAALWDERGLEAMDLQNCLCEFDKYRRLTLGEGKVRNTYDGAGGMQGFLI